MKRTHTYNEACRLFGEEVYLSHFEPMVDMILEPSDEEALPRLLAELKGVVGKTKSIEMFDYAHKLANEIIEENKEFDGIPRAEFLWWFENCGEEGVFVHSCLTVNGRDIPYDGENSVTMDRMKAKAIAKENGWTFVDMVDKDLARELREAKLEHYRLWVR